MVLGLWSIPHQDHIQKEGVYSKNGQEEKELKRETESENRNESSTLRKVLPLGSRVSERHHQSPLSHTPRCSTYSVVLYSNSSSTLPPAANKVVKRMHNNIYLLDSSYFYRPPRIFSLGFRLLHGSLGLLHCRCCLHIYNWSYTNTGQCPKYLSSSSTPLQCSFLGAQYYYY